VHCDSIPEFLFKDFEKRTEADATYIIGYLAHMYGDQHCSHKVEQIGDCLVYEDALGTFIAGTIDGVADLLHEP
jgi:hypothetical protein